MAIEWRSLNPQMQVLLRKYFFIAILNPLPVVIIFVGDNFFKIILTTEKLRVM
jgi:hypothetical protein